MFHLTTFSPAQHLDNGYACQLYINTLTAWILTTETNKIDPRRCVNHQRAGNSAIGKIFSQRLSQSRLAFKSSLWRPQPKRALTTSKRNDLDAKNDLVAQIRQLGLPQPTVAFDAIGGSPGTDLIHTLNWTRALYQHMVRFLWIFMSHVSSVCQKPSYRVRYLPSWGIGKKLKEKKHAVTNSVHARSLHQERDSTKSTVIFLSEQIRAAIDLIESKTTRLDGKIIPQSLLNTRCTRKLWFSISATSTCHWSIPPLLKYKLLIIRYKSL